MLGPSVVTLTVELLDSRRQLRSSFLRSLQLIAYCVPPTHDLLELLPKRHQLLESAGQLGPRPFRLGKLPASRIPQLLLGLRGAPALLLERLRTLLGPGHEPVALPLELPHTLLLPLRGGLGRFDSGGLIGSLPRQLARAPLVLDGSFARGSDGLPLLLDGVDELLCPPLVLTCRRLGSLDGALVPALEVGELRPQFAHRVFGHLPRLPVGLTCPLELGRRTLTLARRCLGLREPRALVGALPLELLEPPGGDGGRSFGGLACARCLVACIRQSLLELGRGRVRSLERAASRVPLRRDLLQPTRS